MFSCYRGFMQDAHTDDLRRSVTSTKTVGKDRYRPIERDSDLYGDDVRVHATPAGSTEGMLVHHRHLTNRGSGGLGTLSGYVPGHGGDVWFVKMNGSGIAVFATDEIRVLDGAEVVS